MPHVDMPFTQLHAKNVSYEHCNMSITSHPEFHQQYANDQLNNCSLVSNDIFQYLNVQFKQAMLFFTYISNVCVNHCADKMQAVPRGHVEFERQARTPYANTSFLEYFKL